MKKPWVDGPSWVAMTSNHQLDDTHQTYHGISARPPGSDSSGDRLWPGTELPRSKSPDIGCCPGVLPIFWAPGMAKALAVCWAFFSLKMISD